MLKYKEAVMNLIKATFGKNLNLNKFKFDTVAMEDGTLLYWDGELEIGKEIFLDEDKTESTGPGLYIMEKEGLYLLINEDGLQAVLKGTEIGEISDSINKEGESSEESEESDEERDDTKLTQSKLEDGTIIYYDGELLIGVTIFTDESMKTIITDDEYTLEDNRILIIIDGKVKEISENDEENDEENEELKKEIDYLSDENIELKKIIEKILKTEQMLHNKIKELNGKPKSKPIYISN